MEDIRLAIDAYTLDVATGKKPLKDIEQDGTLVYEQDEPARAEFAEQVERLWTEIPGGLLDLTEAQLETMDPEDDAVQREEVQGDENTDEKQSGASMTMQAMEELRFRVLSQLNDARNELWYVLELAKTLAISGDFTSEPPPMPNSQGNPTKKRKAATGMDGPAVPSLQPGVEPPSLPPGTYTTTPGRLHPQPANDAYELELALAAKHAALDECSVLIDNAVEELQAMAEAGDRFWDNLRQLKDGRDGRGQWAVVPRPDFGRTMVEGERAKDVIIPYALDEAAPALRARSLAAFDLDPNKLDSLTFGARTYLRLRVTLDSAVGLQSSILAVAPGSHDVRALMDAVQAEAMDEDLFNETASSQGLIVQLRNEALSRDITVDGNRIVVAVGDTELVFELYDIRSPPSTPSLSAKCNLIIQTAQLSLLQLHRHRKHQLVEQASRLSPQYQPGPSILAPILEGLRYHQLAQSALGTLRMFSDAATRTGFTSEVTIDWAEYGPGGIELQSEDRAWIGDANMLSTLSGEIKLEIEGLHGIRLTASSTRFFTLHTSRSSFSLASDIADLPALVAADLATQLLTFAQDVIQGTVGASLRERVFMDDLAGVVALPEACLSVALPPPYSSIHAKLEPDDPSAPVEAFDPLMMSLREWLEGLSRHVAG